MALTTKQKKVATNMYLYIVVNNRMDEMAEYVADDDLDKEELDELISYIKESLEQKVANIKAIPCDLREIISMVKEEV